MAEALVEEWDGMSLSNGGGGGGSGSGDRRLMNGSSHHHRGRHPSNPHPSSGRTAGSSGGDYMASIRTQHQLERLLEKKEAFCSVMDEYRAIWYPISSNRTGTATATQQTSRSIKEQEQVDDIASAFASALEFQHPPLPMIYTDPDTSSLAPASSVPSSSSSLSSPSSPSSTFWRQVVESEDLFRRICTLNHELFVAAAALSEDWNYFETPQQGDNTTTAKSGVGSRNDNWGEDSIMASILPFWEAMRKDRQAIVDICQPLAAVDNEDGSNAMSLVATPPTGWTGGLMKSVLRTLGLGGGMQELTSKLDVPVTAHLDQECAPNHYHYAKVSGNIYFHYQPLIEYEQQIKGFSTGEIGDEELMDDDELQIGEMVDAAKYDDSAVIIKRQHLLQQRAHKLQALIDQCPSNDVLSTKIVRLLVRSYLDIGTLEASRQAERVFNRFPNHRTGLLWYVLQSYMKTMENEIDRKKAPSQTEKDWHFWDSAMDRDDSSGPTFVATRRICELLSSAHSSNSRDFRACSILGFQALAAAGPNLMDGYYDRVHSLGILRFGPKVWEALMNEDVTKQVDLSSELHGNDFKVLHFLILIYSKGPDYLDRAIRLLEVAFHVYDVNELEESFRRTTFLTMMDWLNKKKLRRLKVPKSERAATKPSTNTLSGRNPELDASFKIFDKMILHQSWFPNGSTFHRLFRLCDGGPDADRVLAKLELCRGFTSLSNANEFSTMDKGGGGSSSTSDDILLTLKVARYTLNAWFNTAAEQPSLSEHEQGTVDPAVRAWEILRSLQVMSSPPLFLPMERVSHLYDRSCEPDESIYTLVLKVCSRATPYSDQALDVALRVWEIVQKEGRMMEGSICANLLYCISNVPDVNRRIVLMKEVYQVALAENPKLKQAIVAHLEKQFSYYEYRHPGLYDQHLRELNFEGTFLKSRKRSNDYPKED